MTWNLQLKTGVMQQEVFQHFQIFFQNNVVCVVEISQDEDEDTEFEINVQKSPKNIQIWIDVGKVKS